MKLHRTLLGGLVATAVGVTLVLPAATPTSAAGPEPDLSGAIDRVQADLAGPPDLSRGSEVTGDGGVVFRAARDASDTGINATVPVTIRCLLAVFDPRVALQPTEVQATARVDCNFPVPVMVAGVALYRQGENSSLSSRVATGIATDDVQVSTFTPCRTSAYVALGTATVFFPPGFSPPVGHATVVSNVVLLAATGTPVPPFTCKRPPQPTPEPPPTPPTPGPGPVIHGLQCEYLGASQYDCSLGATGWTQIRWTYNGARVPGWDDEASPFPNATCGGGIPTIKAYVSNAYGTTIAQDSFRCEGQPL